MSRPAHRAGHRAQGRSRLAVAVALVLAPASTGHALTAPSTVPRTSRPGCHRVRSGTFEVASLVENCPGDAGELVGERDRQHVVMQPRLGSFDPGFEPVALPALRPDQHHPGRLHEQDAQVAIATLGYLTEDGAGAGRDLPRHQSEPGGEVAALGENVARRGNFVQRTGATSNDHSTVRSIGEEADGFVAKHLRYGFAFAVLGGL